MSLNSRSPFTKTLYQNDRDSAKILIGGGG